jgi:hypothetical protein
MKFKLILICFIVFTLASCKVYEVKHSKGIELDKATNVAKANVYLFAQKNTFKVTNPVINKDGVSGGLQLVTDHDEAAEIRNPETPRLMKKHQKDLDLYTKTTIGDSAVSVSLKKADINEYSQVLVHSKVNWKKVGEITADVFGIAASLAILAAFVYWFTLI